MWARAVFVTLRVFYNTRGDEESTTCKYLRNCCTENICTALLIQVSSINRRSIYNANSDPAVICVSSILLDSNGHNCRSSEWHTEESTRTFRSSEVRKSSSQIQSRRMCIKKTGHGTAALLLWQFIQPGPSLLYWWHRVQLVTECREIDNTGQVWRFLVMVSSNKLDPCLRTLSVVFVICQQIYVSETRSVSVKMLR